MMTEQEIEKFREEFRAILFEEQKKIKQKPVTVSIIDEERVAYADEICRLIASDLIVDDGLLDVKSTTDSDIGMITIRIIGNNIKFKTGKVLCVLLDTAAQITPLTNGTLDIIISINKIKKEI